MLLSFSLYISSICSRLDYADSGGTGVSGRLRVWEKVLENVGIGLASSRRSPCGCGTREKKKLAWWEAYR